MNITPEQYDRLPKHLKDCFTRKSIRPIDNITATGAGALWIDGARIGTSGSETHGANAWGGEIYGEYGAKETVVHNKGRWASNFYLVGDEAARRLDEQSGERPGATSNSDSGYDGRGVYSKGWAGQEKRPGYSDSGGASRFFLRVSEQIDEADPVRYCAKASRRERDAGLEEWEARKIETMGKFTRPSEGRTAEKNGGEKRNPHPTVKPLALTRYLATLLLPPAEYAPRRIFCPFAGVASEAIGAMQAGWEHVEGVELTEEYLPIARARVEYWQERMRQEAQQIGMEL